MSSATSENLGVKISGKEKLLLLLLLVLLLLAYHQLFSWETASEVVPGIVEAFFSVSGISPQFLYLLVIGLLFIRREDIAIALRHRGEPWFALLFLVPGVCLLFWGLFVDALDLVHVSFILVVFGTARFLAGKQLTRALLSPILILLLGTPLPAVLINQIIFPMQLWDTAHSVWLLNAIGIPASAMGDMISMAGSSAHFAESCTALGFTLWLTIFALAYVYIFRISRWHAVLLVLSAPVIAYVVNLLRAFSLVLNPAMEVLSIHTVQGIVFFLIGFSLLYAIDTVLMRMLGNNCSAEPDVENGKTASKSAGLTVLVCLFMTLAFASFMMPRWDAPAIKGNQTISLPARVGEWAITDSPRSSYSFLGSVRYSATAYRDYNNGVGKVSVFIGEDDRLRRKRSLLSGKNAYPDGIGLEQESYEINLGPGIGNVVVKVLDNGTQRLMTYHWYNNTGSHLKEILYSFLALDQSPFRREEHARVLRFTTYVELAPGGRERAHKRLQGFINEFREIMP